MKPNMRKLNDDTTEIRIIHPKSAHHNLLPEGVRIGNIHVTPNTHTRNLGMTFESITTIITLQRHVTLNSVFPSPQLWTHSSLFRTWTCIITSKCPGYITC
ncbi:hypothetical protein NP493_1152g00023 [Ridgeia piscesae]|uniref:Uncharacterized protein n=1 Tax=Ridgeia piscesae TaxID=27915 RepID=A0AAD9NHP2_RIDPI|nr:hypothetical protein NP493_1152g00023 [Ridgeia piscesae]